MLSQSDQGYVFACSGCRLTQVAFGTTLVTLQSADFLDFRHDMRQLLSEDPADACPYLKRIVVPLATSGCRLLLNRSELTALVALLDEAWFSMELELLVGPPSPLRPSSN